MTDAEIHNQIVMSLEGFSPSIISHDAENIVMEKIEGLNLLQLLTYVSQNFSDSADIRRSLLSHVIPSLVILYRNFTNWQPSLSRIMVDMEGRFFLLNFRGAEQINNLSNESILDQIMATISFLESSPIADYIQVDFRYETILSIILPELFGGHIKDVNLSELTKELLGSKFIYNDPKILDYDDIESLEGYPSSEEN